MTFIFGVVVFRENVIGKVHAEDWAHTFEHSRLDERGVWLKILVVFFAFIINCDGFASCTRPCLPNHDIPDPHLIELVFLISLTSIDDNVGSEDRVIKIGARNFTKLSYRRFIDNMQRRYCYKITN